MLGSKPQAWRFHDYLSELLEQWSLGQLLRALEIVKIGHSMMDCVLVSLLLDLLTELSKDLMRPANVGALIMRRGFWGLQITAIVIYPKPYSNYSN